MSRLNDRLIKHFYGTKDTIDKKEFELKVMDRPLGNIIDLLALRAQIDDTQVIPNRFANPFKNMRIKSLQTSV